MCGTDEVRRNPRELTATSLLRSPVLQPASLLLSFRVFLCCLYVRPSVSVELRRRNRERHVFFIFPEAEVSQQHFKNGANVGETGLVLGSINDIYSNQQNSMLLPWEESTFWWEKLILKQAPKHFYSGVFWVWRKIVSKLLKTRSVSYTSDHHSYLLVLSLTESHPEENSRKPSLPVSLILWFRHEPVVLLHPKETSVWRWKKRGSTTERWPISQRGR